MYIIGGIESLGTSSKLNIYKVDLLTNTISLLTTN